VFLTIPDLAPFTDASDDMLNVMIADVEALAVRAAPCLADPDYLSSGMLDAVVAILRGAVLRWSEFATRDARSMSAGPFTIGGSPGYNNQERKPLLWPSEVASLRDFCPGARGTAYVGWLA